MWLIANVAEADIPKLKLNQKIAVSITALPDQVLEGRITNIGASIDPSTRRLAVRTEIQDTKQLLKQQMLATYVIETSEPVHLVAVPANGIVREGDGTMTVFVTSDSRTFTRRAVRVGPEQQGWVPILEGLKDGENVATDGAIFLNNALQLQAR
jgi:cobalt-zinc-cadmium efflux system membrane fusion protein